ncbi:putative lipoprotein [Herminiimonas arsenicoxydans]|uniref:Lipoprotein n=1 Tax=Herminiimonas arsenicoxydans TaxID=204773 RepID=A4G9J9_HERAR|nr:putative lipoprotein [Herminiimonas arsenicoxydans]
MKTTTKAIFLVSALLLGGCATSSNNANDPFEGFNRTMFEFNDTVDRVALKPAATAYQEVLPSFAQTAVGNFFGNLGDIWTMVNNFLQGNVENGLSDGMRVAFNSTIGFGGLLDIASEAGITKHKEDFGQTLGVWGVESGPYVVLPFFGPSTMRDTVALPVDIYGDVWTYSTPVDRRNVGILVRTVDLRASALSATNLLEDAALDRYTFVRGAYLQRRESLIHKGEEPATKPQSDKIVDPQSDADHILLPITDAVVGVDGAAVEPPLPEAVENLANESVVLM